MAESREEGYFFDLKKIMSERQLSQSDLASLTGVSPNTIKRALAGRSPVSAYTVAKIVQGLNGFRIARDDDFHVDFEKVFTRTSDLRSRVEISTENATIEDLNPMDFCALALTNAVDWGNTPDEIGFRFLTSKDVYLLLPAIDRLINESPNKTVFERELNNFEDRLLALFRTNTEDAIPSIPRHSRDAKAISLDEYGLGYSLEEGTRANGSLKKLYDKGLIVDPIIETVGTVAIAAVGIVPTSFTKRTNDGDLVYRKVTSLLWDYEYQKEGENESREIHFRAEKAVELIKKCVAVVHEAMNKNNEEPEN